MIAEVINIFITRDINWVYSGLGFMQIKQRNVIHELKKIRVKDWLSFDKNVALQVYYMALQNPLHLKSHLGV